jgi:multidrug efflux pump subunit AcrA (membrane-fusion protein)
MKSRKLWILVLLTTGLFFSLAACTSSNTETPAFRPIIANNENLISATGQVVPDQEASLSVSTGGVVENVLIQKGDAVVAGQVLVQLEGTEQQAAVVSAADLALANANFALEKLYKDTNLMAAQALRSAETAEEALENLYNTEQQEALAIQAVADAQQRLDTAERDLTTLTNVPSQEAIDQTYNNLLLAEKKLENTTEQIEDTEWQIKKYSTSNLPPNYKNKIIKNLRQALKGLEIQRTQDQLAYNRAETKYNDLQTPPNDTDVAVAETEYQSAKATLAQAQRDLERIQEGPDAGDVAVLEAQIEKGYRDYEIYSAGPDPDDVALAEAQVADAEAQLVAAKEILANLELTAPFDGVISEVYINPSEWVAPGTTLLLLANLEGLQVKTTDLSEIDVAKIKVGDTAMVSFDAFPDLTVEGTVIRIAPKADTSAGINYPVTLELNEIPTELRWGMTAFVDIPFKGSE